MAKIIEFLKSNKYVIIWTLGYIVITWAVLQWLFNFNIFNPVHWQMLKHIHIHSFPSIVFGLLILAAIPTYIATTAIIFRTKKPLFSVPLPKFLEPVPEEKPSTENAETEDISTEPETKEDPISQKIIPTELHAAFVRARAHIGPAPKSNFDIGNVVSTTSNPATVLTQEVPQSGELPLPNDFDIAPTNEAPTFSDIPSFTPIFSDIEPEAPENTAKEENLTTPDISETSEDLKPVIDYLKGKDKEFIIQDNLILTNQDVIAAHNDSDFWIADEKTWFASGKQKPSPIEELITKSSETNLPPILYLGSTNILDLETNIKDWEDAGIKVITDLNELK